MPQHSDLPCHCHVPRPAPPPAAARVLQVMRLGAPVTSLSLGPGQDLLATSHVGKRGVYLWSNQASGVGWGRRSGVSRRAQAGEGFGCTQQPVPQAQHRSPVAAHLTTAACLTCACTAPPHASLQMLFGSGADIVPSEDPVRVRLPSITATAADGTGTAARQDAAAAADELRAMLRQTAGMGGAKAAAAGSESEEEEEELRAQGVQQPPAEPESSDASSDEEFAAEAAAAAAARRQRQRRQAAAAPELDPAAAAAAAAYAARDAAGAPRALEPELVTLSMLPRTQWQNLVHLDTIKVG